MRIQYSDAMLEMKNFSFLLCKHPQTFATKNQLELQPECKRAFKKDICTQEMKRW